MTDSKTDIHILIVIDRFNEYVDSEDDSFDFLSNSLGYDPKFVCFWFLLFYLK